MKFFGLGIYKKFSHIVFGTQLDPPVLDVKEHESASLASILRELHVAIEAFGVRCWIDQGTLLGAIRSNSFLKEEKDIDLGILYKDVPNLFRSIPFFKDMGFDVRIHCNDVALIKNRFPVVIAVYQPVKGDHYLHLDSPCINLREQNIFYWKCRWRYRLETVYNAVSYRKLHVLRDNIERSFFEFTKPMFKRSLVLTFTFMLWKLLGGKFSAWFVPDRQFYDELDVVTFYGMEFNTPSSVEEYLAFKYGADWTIEMKNPEKWNIWTDDGARLRHTDVEMYSPFLGLDGRQMK